MHVTEIAVRRPVTVIMVLLAIMMLGLYSFHRLSVDFLPAVDVPQLLIKTECPNVGAVEVEREVTQVIEASLSTLQDLHRVSSISRQGISLVYLNFNWGSDIDLAFIKARSKLDRMQDILPKFSERSTILRFDPASAPIMTLVVTGDRITNFDSPSNFQAALAELKNVSSSIVKRRLEQIEGVAYVSISGGLDREIKIHLNQKNCLAYRVEYADVERALRDYNVSALGGSIVEGHFQFPLRIEAEYKTIEEIKATPVKITSKGRNILLEDIARVEDGFQERNGYTRLNGNEVITLLLYKEADANTVKTSERVYGALQSLFLEFPEFHVIPIFDQAEFIRESIDGVVDALYLGGVFAFLVLFLFLKDLKSPIVIGLAIPASIISTIILMFFLKISFNVISLGGLALGIGLLVDNSIVVLENIHRFREEGFSPYDSAVRGTKEVSLAITASTFTTISVFFPLIYFRGYAGELFYDQSMTIAASLTVSLVFSITLIPMLASADIGQGLSGFGRRRKKASCDKTTGGGIESSKSLPFLRIAVRAVGLLCDFTVFLLYDWVFKPITSVIAAAIRRFHEWFDFCMRFYERVLAKSLQNRKKVVLITLASLASSAIALMIVKREMMPPVDDKHLIVYAESAIGTRLDVMTSNISRLERMIMQLQGVEQVLSSIGITEASLDQGTVPGVNKAILQVRVAQDASTSHIERLLDRLFSQFPNLKFDSHQRGSIFERFFDRFKERFDVRISGPELETLERISEQFVDQMAQTPTFRKVATSMSRSEHEYEIKIHREKLVEHGIGVSELADFLDRQIQGVVPTKFSDFSEKVDIKVISNSPEEFDIRALSELHYPITFSDTSMTKFVPVRQLISIEPTTGFSEITRENQSRHATINAILNGVDFDSAAKELQSFLEQIESPAGYEIEIGTHRRAIMESYHDLLLVLLISIALIYFIVSAQFESAKISLVIIAAIPLSFIGVVMTLLATNHSLNLMSFIGAIVLAGIVVNDSIVKIDFIHRRFLLTKDLKGAILEAGRKRFRPILMTTATTVCGLLPMALSLGGGSELRQPLAWVLVGGIIMATTLTLIVVPIVYSMIVESSV